MRSLVWAVALIATCACGTDVTTTPPDPAATRAEEDPASALDPDNPARLRTPFSAEEIRDEWVEGLQLTLEMVGPDGPVVQRWTVVGADEEAVEIAFEVLDASGAPQDEPTVRRSTWVELRDHASFPADRAERRWVTRDTAFGSLAGWLYTMQDDEGMATEYFFASSLPGAPVEMRTLRDGETVIEMRQVSRIVRASPA